MKTIQRFALWAALLTKRLLRRPVFPILLLCVPLLSGAMAIAARQESGVITVALVCDTGEPEAQRSAERLLRADSLVRCTAYETEDDARAAVESGDADAAWIFRDGAAEELERFVSGRRTRGMVTVVEREDNVYLLLARELLAAAVYPEASHALFRDHLIRALGVPEDAGDEVFAQYYSVQVMEQPIIVFSTTNGAVRESVPGYLVTPVRGLLALLLMLTGLASCLYAYRDAERGAFLRLGAPRRRFLPLLSHLCALVPVALAVYGALCAAGLLTAPLREAGLLLLYCLSVAAFCELLRKLCRSETRLGALIPVLLAAMLTLCPVFWEIEALAPAGRLFPPYYYLYGVGSARYVRALALYTAAAAALAAALPERDGS